MPPSRFCISFWIDGAEMFAYADTMEQAVNCAETLRETTSCYGVEIKEMKDEPENQ